MLPSHVINYQVMLIMTSVIRVGQSKFVTVPIDEDSNERILSCIQTLGELRERTGVNDMFLKDTRVAYGKMLGAQEVRAGPSHGKVELKWLTPRTEACGRKEGSREHQGEYRAGRRSTQLPPVLEEIGRRRDKREFKLVSLPSVSESRQYADDLGKATGAAEVHEDFISNLSRISQLTGK